MGAIFSDAEIQGRLGSLRRALAEAGLDAVVLGSFPAIYHATGAPIHQFGRPAAAVVPVAGEPAIVCSVIEREHVAAQSPIEDVRVYRDYNPDPVYEDSRPPLDSMAHRLGEILRDRELSRGRLGFEEAGLRVRTRDAIGSASPDATWVPASGLVDRLRQVKTPEELELLRAADAIADDGLQAALDVLRAGATAREIHERARGAMLDAVLARHPATAFNLRVDTGLGAAARSAGHSEWITWDATSIASPGQIVVLVVDCILWGYTGNVERTVAVGEPSPPVRRDFETMVEANERAIAAVRPGVRLAEVDRICKEVFAAAGHGTRTGSGVGRGPISYEGDWRELAMDVRLYSDVVLEAGMAFSIEPDLRTAEGAYRHCNTIIVTPGGREVDSRLPRGVLVA